MSRTYALAFLTVPDLQPVEAIRIAAETGYDSVGLRLLPAAATGEEPYPILTDPTVLAEARAALADTGMRVGDVEIVRLKPETRAGDFIPFLECAATLGASNILVAGDDPEPARLSQTFGAFALLASRYGLTADLEFMPWTGVRDAATALAVVEGAGQPNGGVLVDALHWHRTGGRIDDLALIPPGRIHYVQLCDAPADFDPSDEGLIAIARGGRLMPGDGGIDLAAFVHALPDDVPVSVEVASAALTRRLTPRERATQALATAKAVIAGAYME
ncbi:sugar phosphate isomerase/epimerase [Rhizobiaceae bacterium BDR2-2]|uniref:Sugar phosphate isomerase/epimerase n=1 Tax=Ectorhizobium quercum TaxID=2965071 RepID=A0AAE3N092_9HYPH|nr:sugar phosphate isomerase/epimerase [Ectorhizobium quercum]MCX8998224.1 sugar phosphate isomerase/epimerase [Ectorhizobium quercum]